MFNHPIQALTVIVEFAVTPATPEVLIDNPVEPPLTGFANKNGQQWPTICWLVTN